MIDDEISILRESEEKLKTQQTEASRRENVLVMRLAAKEQEMQEYVVIICTRYFYIKGEDDLTDRLPNYGHLHVLVLGNWWR